MRADRSALDSAAATIDDLVKRVSDAADRFEHDGEDTIANDLYEVERALEAAARRLHHVVRALDD
jgi:hypothetical protein